MILDAHHQLWRFNTADYGWMDESMKVLHRDYLPSDLETEIEKERIYRLNAIDCYQPEL